MRIVQDAEDSKEEAGNFISKFNNKIFTLNYDPFLYKIALYLAKKNKQITSEFGQLISGHEQNFDDISLPNDCLFDDLNKTEKATLYAACLSEKGKKTAFIKEAMTYLSQKEQPQTTGWKMKDGFSKYRQDFCWTENTDQNLFYLHGALHIYQDTSEIKKISVGRLDTLKSRIIERIDESKPLDIIFKSTDKIKDINNNQYMKSALEQLKKITGNIYLYGVSLSENDNHIWEAINNNDEVTQVYVSVYCNDGIPDLKIDDVQKMLPNKKALITLFDSGSINK
jgi:hypothetical protein